MYTIMKKTDDTLGKVFSSMDRKTECERSRSHVGLYYLGIVVVTALSNECRLDSGWKQLIHASLQRKRHR